MTDIDLIPKTLTKSNKCTQEYEQKITNESKCQCIIGIDECGTGALAGPVTVCACHIPLTAMIKGINDSKKISEKKREKLWLELTQHPEVKYAVVHIPHERVDEINVLQARLEGMQLAYNQLKMQLPNIDCVLVDGTVAPPFSGDPLVSLIVGGDGQCTCIGAASILAKVSRDKLMCQYHQQYPGYGFDRHKGYGVQSHMQVIKDAGICDIHRRSFGPCKKSSQ